MASSAAAVHQFAGVAAQLKCVRIHPGAGIGFYASGRKRINHPVIGGG
jgi:hypothetical protein